ncbi:MAG: aspartate 1-decarboxylase [Halobacteriales archaeon]
MQRELLKSKIHRARVTRTDLAYEGSLTLDPALLEAADIAPYEKVQVVNVTNGERLETYAIEGEPGSGEVCLNGAAARLGEVDDVIIVLSFGSYGPDEPHDPRVVHVDAENDVTEVA